MREIDVNEQWRVLQESYAAMADEELEVVAIEAYDLTDIARQVLQAEISRRHLTITPCEARPSEAGSESEDELPALEESGSPNGYPEDFDPEDWGLIIYTHIETIEQAREVKACFDEAGIPSYYGPDVVDDLRRLKLPLSGPLLMKIREVDLPRAHSMWQRCFPAPVEEEESGAEDSDYAVRCPKCHSTEVVFRKLDTAKLAPGESPKFSWKCDACDYRWKDSGVGSKS